MKVRKQNFDKDGKGSVTLVAEESEDLWHLYNLVAEGDEVQAVTYRKVQRDEGKGSETKKLRLTIQIKSTEYDAEGDAIRFAGTVCEENEWVKMGAHHTIEIELHEPITITKECWDARYAKELEDATDIAKSAETAVVLMEAKDAAMCNVNLLTNVLCKRVGRVEQALPRKRVTNTQLDKALEKFFLQTYDCVKQKLNLEVVKCVVLAGPGTTKNEFNTWMQKHAMQEGDSNIVQKKSMFVCVTTSSIHNEGIRQILADDQVQRRVANTRAAKHFKALEELQKRLANQPDMACYGLKEVKKALSMGAIETMMVADTLFRTSSVKVRREYVDLVSEAEASSSTAFVFSSRHITGQELDKLTGIAALLRHPIEFDEQEDEEEGEATGAPEAAAQEAPSSEPQPKPEPQREERVAAPAGPKMVTLELMSALGGRVSEARVEQALARSKGAPEEAFLVLLGEELDGTAQEPEPKPASPSASPPVSTGATVEVLDAFASNNKTPVQLPKGSTGKVIKINGAGDAYIDFGELGKQWIKSRNFHLLKASEAAPHPREEPREVKKSSAPAPAKAASSAAAAATAKPAAKAAGKAASKPKAKAKKASASLQWDDYDY